MTKFNRPSKDHTDKDSTQAKVSNLWFEMPYTGQKREQLVRSLKKKQSRCFNIANVEIRTTVKDNQTKLFTNVKNRVPKQNKSNIVYEFTCQKLTTAI